MSLNSYRALLLGLTLTASLLCTCGTAADPAPGATDASCFDNPTTHIEIINSCADVVSYEKPAQLPKFQPGAKLMPLP